MNSPTHYKFRVECDVDYDRLKLACGDVMINPKVEKKYNEIDFQSYLPFDELLEIFDSVMDAHIAFQTLMPLEKYTGDRHYFRKECLKFYQNKIKKYDKEEIEKDIEFLKVFMK